MMAARQPVSVLTTHGAAEFNDQGAHLVANAPDLFDLRSLLEIDERTNVDTTDGGVAVVSAHSIVGGQQLLKAP